MGLTFASSSPSNMSSDTWRETRGRGWGGDYDPMSPAYSPDENVGLDWPIKVQRFTHAEWSRTWSHEGVAGSPQRSARSWPRFAEVMHAIYVEAGRPRPFLWRANIRVVARLSRDDAASHWRRVLAEDRRRPGHGSSSRGGRRVRRPCRRGRGGRGRSRTGRGRSRTSDFVSERRHERQARRNAIGRSARTSARQAGARDALTSRRRRSRGR